MGGQNGGMVGGALPGSSGPWNFLQEPRYELFHQGDDLTKLVWLDSLSKPRTTSVLFKIIKNGVR